MKPVKTYLRQSFTIQGFLKDAWTGPQILAHHLLLMLTRWVIINHLGDVDDEDTVDFDLGKDDGLDGGIWHNGGDEGVTGVWFRTPSVSET